jgi:hypothetical protein
VSLSKWNKSAAESRSSNLVTEVNAVIQVRGICLTARAAAEITAADSENTEAVRAYENAKKKSILVAEGVSDKFYRDTSLHFIYALCQKANDHAAAKRIFDRIATDEIRGNILDGRPALFD